MRNLLGLIIAIFCLMWMPAQAQAAKQGKPAKASKAAPAPKAGKIFRDCPSCPEMVVISFGEL